MNEIIQSRIDRQNLLNNNIAINEIEKEIDIQGFLVDGVYYFTNQQIADFFEVDIRTLRRLIEDNLEELTENGYKTLSGRALSAFREKADSKFVKDIFVSHKARNLAISTFRTLLNFAMLLSNNDKAKEIRKNNLKFNKRS